VVPLAANPVTIAPASRVQDIPDLAGLDPATLQGYLLMEDEQHAFHVSFGSESTSR
jgi:hypothetical protein